MTPEGKLKAEVKAYLDAMPQSWVVLRLNSGTVRKGNRFIKLCETGTADVYIANERGTYWLELKGVGQTTAKARKLAQAEFGERVTALGHRYAIVTDLEQLKEFLKISHG